MITQNNKQLFTILKLSGVILGLIMLFAYLVAYRAGIYLPLLFFWLGFLITLSILVYQAITDESHSIVVLTLFFLLVWGLKMIFVPSSVPYFGSDPYYEEAATLEIAEKGWLGLSPWKLGLSTWYHSTNYPFISAISISLTAPIKFPLSIWTRWSMPTLSIISVSLVYIISVEVYESRRAALLGSIGFGMTYMFLMFHSLYLRETMAFTLFLSTIFALIKSRSEINTRAKYFYLTTAILCGLATVFAHHLTALLLASFVLLFLIVQYITSHLSSINLVKSYRISISFFLILIVGLLTHWVYLRYTPFLILNGVVDESTSGATMIPYELPNTFRFNFLLYGQIITTLSFGFLALYYLLSSKWSQNIFTIVAILWGCFAGLASLSIALIGLPGIGSLANRFELFGYAFLLPAAACGLLRLIESRRWLYLPLGLLFILYGFISVYRFPIYLYTSHQPDLSRGETRVILFPEEYRLLSNINSQTDIASGIRFRRLFHPIAGMYAINFDINEKKESPSLDYAQYIVYDQDEMKLLSEFHGVTPQELGLSKIYQSGTVVVYTKSTDLHPGFSIDNLFDNREQNSTNGESVSILSIVLFILEIVMIVLSGYAILSIGNSFKIEYLGFGIILVLLLIFFAYLMANSLGFQSPGIIPLLILAGLTGLSYYQYRNQKLTASINIFVIFSAFMTILLFVFAMEVVSSRIVTHPYSEFYVENIITCEKIDCINLRLTNNEGKITKYQLSGLDEEIILNPHETWLGTVEFDRHKNKYLEIILNKSNDSTTNESIFLQFD